MENQDIIPTQKESSFFSDFGSFLENITVPSIIKKNLIRSVSKLIVGAVDVPVAMLESKSQKIRAESAANVKFIEAAGDEAVKQLGYDPDLVQRSVSHFSTNFFGEQSNREKAVYAAIDDLKLNPPAEDATKIIDEDWLHMFSKIAETKSNAEMQLLLGKILAGEIRSPGSFGAKTVHTLSFLSQETAELFQLFCNISFEVPACEEYFTSVITEPFGNPNNNELLPLGLSYLELSALRDDGLIQHDFQSWRKLSSSVFFHPIKLGNTTVEFTQQNPVPEDIDEQINQDLDGKNNNQVSVLNFTQVGSELRSVMPIVSNITYNDKFIEWAETKFKIKLK